ncbi:hypothetical protein ACX0HA_07670 [Flavobacterium hauense]
MNSFKIYIPVKKFYFTPDRIIYSLAGLGSLPMAFELFILKHESSEVSKFSIGCFWICGLAVFGGVIVRAIYASKLKPLQGKIEGSVVFNNDSITINTDEYSLENLEKISFTHFNDYLGKKQSDKSYYNDGVSNGVENTVILTLKSGRTITCHFQQQYRYQLRELRPQLVYYHNEGKLHFLNLIDILGIEDYNAIQIFKKSLPEGGEVKSY